MPLGKSMFNISDKARASNKMITQTSLSNGANDFTMEGMRKDSAHPVRKTPKDQSATTLVTMTIPQNTQ